MSSLNKVMLIGRLGQKPDIRSTQDGTKVANLSLATSSRYKDNNGEYQEKTEWHRVVAWGRLAEIIEQYTDKGSQIYIEGPMQTRDWEDKEGVKRYTTEVRAFVVTLLDGSQGGGNSGAGSSGGSGSSGSGNQKLSSDVDLNDFDMDDDLPF